jgi:D-3-phosphoglycerate dehydrogenase
MSTLCAVRLNALTYPVEPGEHAALAEAGAELLCIEGRDEAEVEQATRDADAVLVISSYLPAALIEGWTRCRTIARLGAGTDRIAVDVATARGIVVSNVPDFCLGEQADHTMALLLSAARRLPHMQQGMRNGQWTVRAHPGVRRIAGRSLGLVGFGASAQAVARRAGGFGLQLRAWTRNPAKYAATAAALGVDLVGLDDLLAQSHFVSLHLPLSPATHHLLGARELGLLRPDAVLINTARGALVDEGVLVDVLQQGRIAGAALDVFEGVDVFAPPGEPPCHPLLVMDNVIATPHCAGSSVESTRESKLRGALHAAQVLQGRWPAHVVNPEVQPWGPLLPLATPHA